MKTKITFLFALLALTFSCKEQVVQFPNPENMLYARAVFEYSDGTFDASRIFPLEVGRSQRTNQNLVVSGDVSLSDGHYDVVELQGDGKLTITGPVSIGNLNATNGGKEASIFVSQTGELSIGPMNLNGKITVTNKGKIISQSVELQNGKNTFYNYGTHTVIGDLQLSSGGSFYYNCGRLAVSNYTNLHSGDYVACDCGYLETNGLNVNSSEKLSGKGFVKVTGNLNLNAKLTKSSDIEFCYTGNINDKTKLGAAKLTCEPSCKPDALPVRYNNLRLTSSIDNEGNTKGHISFDITENSGLSKMRLETSPDGRRWTTNFTEKPDAFVVGKTYSREFYLWLR